MTVTTSLTGKRGLRHITNTSPAATSKSFSATLYRPHDRKRPSAASLATKITWPNAMRFFFWGYFKDYVFLPFLSQDLPQLRGQLTCQRSIFNCCSGYGSKWIIDLTSAVSQRAARALMRNAKKTLKVSLSICRLYVTISSPFKCSDFMKCVTELWITLYMRFTKGPLKLCRKITCLLCDTWIILFCLTTVTTPLPVGSQRSPLNRPPRRAAEKRPEVTYDNRRIK